MRLQKRYVCVSNTCRREVEIEIPPSCGKTGEISNPTCACGAEMKKVYSAPVLRTLSEAEAIQRFGISTILDMQKTLKQSRSE
jgi:hypothetical protein